jgi:hypothetical protein
MADMVSPMVAMVTTITHTVGMDAVATAGMKVAGHSNLLFLRPTTLD